jgi:hypothetical protein
MICRSIGGQLWEAERIENSIDDDSLGPPNNKSSLLSQNVEYL